MRKEVKNDSKLPSSSFDTVVLVMQNKKTQGYIVARIYNE